MLRGLSFGLLGFLGLFQGPRGGEVAIAPYAPLAWQGASLFELRHQPETQSQAAIDQYLAQLTRRGKDPALQGLWLESPWGSLGQYQGNKPLSAASLTKIATTLAALEQWSVTHRFTTRIYTTGTVEGGKVQGDLIVEAGGDPLLVWEEVIALGNALNQAGIRQIEGNLIIVGDLMLNYDADPETSAANLRLALDQRFWNETVRTAHRQLPDQPPQPQVAIAGQTLTQKTLPQGATPVLTHTSLTLAAILKQMNLYSNNAVAEAIAQHLGGGPAIGKAISNTLQIPSSELQLINGSGLGVENKISPRATVAMLQAIDHKLQGQSLTIFDLFPIVGQDQGGTLKNRTLPPGIALKTGTLNQVSALAGVIPTQTQGNIWFAIINNGTWDISGYRQQQDQFLRTLSTPWQTLSPIPTADASAPDYFGNPERIQILRPTPAPS
ncbi:D-alanyl-D-alanine carboxypeptidase [Synechococcus moorigangaii CMS01]|nr:D-alanyl-D-alanine carboxypeptidase [Synechococcus moorigangaii CMS01]